MNSYWHFYNYWSLLLFMKIIVKAHLPPPHKPPHPQAGQMCFDDEGKYPPKHRFPFFKRPTSVIVFSL